MVRDYLRTSDIARAVGVHPNTVRMYEELGFLPPIPRAANGYRQFTESHLDQMRLARLAMRCTWLSGPIRRSALSMVYDAAAGDLNDALEWGRQLQDAVRAEREQADAAAMYLERWAGGEVEETLRRPLRIGQTAKLLHTTVDSLRHWERNGLISVPRNPRNGYRLYGAVEIGRLRVIRMLVRSGYSTMAVLRMMLQFDQGYKGDLRNVLDTPRPDEELLYFTDQWLSTLADMQDHADRAVVLLKAMIHKS